MPERSAPSESAERGQSRRIRAARLGLGAILVLATALSGPYALWRLRSHRGGATERTRGAAEVRVRDDTAHAATALASLTSALGALGAAQRKILEREAPIVPPAPEDFPSPTACARTYLPDVDVADASLDVLCEETDAWTAEWALYARLSHRRGGEAWTRLGPHTLAALAMIRSGCCPSPKPLTAVVPGLWCGVLRDELRDMGPAPDADRIASYESTMRCLDGRGTHLPERWKNRPKEVSDRAFSALLDVARHRAKR